jgi:hypothetical protein
MVENTFRANLSYRGDIVGIEEAAIDGTPNSKCYDDDGRVKRTGINYCTLYTLYIPFDSLI